MAEPLLLCALTSAAAFRSGADEHPAAVVLVAATLDEPFFDEPGAHAPEPEPLVRASPPVQPGPEVEDAVLASAADQARAAGH